MVGEEGLSTARRTEDELVRVGDDTTLHRQIRNIQMDESSDAVYDLMGNKVADALTPSLRRGIYIHKNKKIIIR